MKQCLSRMFTAAMLIMLGSWLSYGQSNLKDVLTSLAQPVAEKYTAPVVSGFGSNLNTGWFHRSPKDKKFGLDIEFGVVFTGTMFKKKDQHFTHNGIIEISDEMANTIATSYLDKQSWYTNPNLTNDQKTAMLNSLVNSLSGNNIGIKIEGGTFIGKKKDKMILTVGDTTTYTVTDPLGNTQAFRLQNEESTLDIGGVTGQPVVPLAAPQATIGTIMGTQVTLRYLPPVKIYGSVGKLNYFGWGIQHNPAVWLPFKMPMDFAAAFYQQNINQGKLFEAHAIAFGVTVSKQIGFGLLNITPYAGYMRESAKMKFKYEYQLDDNSSVPVSFSAKGVNKYRYTVGSNIKILLVNLNADISFAKKPVYSAGVNFSI